MAYSSWKSYKFANGDFKIFEAIKGQPGCFFLDSSLNPHLLGRYSFLGFNPFCVLKGSGDLKELRRLLSKGEKSCVKISAPFSGGAVGFLSYQGDFCFGLYDTAIVIDHFQGTLGIASFNKTNQKKAVELISQIDFKKQGKPARGGSRTVPTNLVSSFSKNGYLAAVKKAKEYIQAGDIYQVNLSQRFSAQTNLSADVIYQRLRNFSPSCFGAYLDTGNTQIISSSPERFLSLRGRLVHTRPMKGTRPRGESKLKDRKIKGELLMSPKDKAELLMIVDLMRNDLGRVCEYGSVKVSSLRNFEKYSTVFQTTADIQGRLHAQKDRVDLINACFPGGSITGCPKIRAMEVIKDLESVPRGAYTGSLGYLSFSGEMDLNILIRTIVKEGQQIYFHVGGGIVADSRPEDEYAETLVKAKAMMQAVQ